MDWDSNTLWGIIGLIGGIIISFFFYYISIKRKKISYNIYTFNIIKDKISQIEGLEIKYQSSPIDNLNSSIVIIENSGNSVIERENLAPSCPITIFTTGQFLFDNEFSENLFFIEEEKQVHLIPNYTNNVCTSIIIDFDYLSKGDKLHYTFTHSGEIHLSAALKDGKVINKELKNHSHYFFISLYTFIFTILITIVITLYVSSKILL